jgi:hypothetical protein
VAEIQTVNGRTIEDFVIGDWVIGVAIGDLADWRSVGD